MNKRVKARKKKMVLYCHRGPSARHVVLLAVGCCLVVITFATCSFFFFFPFLYTLRSDEKLRGSYRTGHFLCANVYIHERAKV